MPASLDRVRVTWEGTGTSSPISLGSAVSARFIAPVDAIDGAEVSYLIEHQGEGIDEAEWGRGVYTHSGSTLARTEIIGSTNGGFGGSLVNFSAGVKHVTFSLLASDLQARFISALPEGTLDPAADYVAFWDATDQQLKKAHPPEGGSGATPAVIEATPDENDVYLLSTAVRYKPENVVLITVEADTQFQVPADFGVAEFKILSRHSGCTIAIEGNPEGRIIDGVEDGDPIQIGPAGSTVDLFVLGDNEIQHEGEGVASSTALGDVDMADFELKKAALIDTAEVSPDFDTSVEGDYALDYENGQVQELVLTDDLTSLTINNWPAAGNAGWLTVIVDTANNDYVHPAGVLWPGGTPPSATADGIDIYTYITRDGGATVYGFEGGLDFS